MMKDKIRSFGALRYAASLLGLLSATTACDEGTTEEAGPLADEDLAEALRKALDPDDDPNDANGIIARSEESPSEMEADGSQRALSWFLEDCRWGYLNVVTGGGHHSFSDEDYKVVSTGCGLPVAGTIIGLQMALPTYNFDAAHGLPIPDGTALQDLPSTQSGNVACHNWYPASGPVEYSALFCRVKLLNYGWFAP